MKRMIATVLLVCMLTGCAAAESREDRAEGLRERYAALTDYTAEARVRLVREEGDLNYTLRCEAGGETVKVQVLAPEELAGVTAQLTGEKLRLSYDGIVLDAGELGGVNAVNALPLALRAVGEGYLLEQGEEDFGDTENALCVSFEGEYGGRTLGCTLRFDAYDSPLYAEIAENEEIIAYIEFTNFVFGDKITTDQ